MRSILAAVVVLLGACGGSDGTCRSSAECSSREECAGPDGSPACGIAPQEGCATDTDCPGARCHAIVDGCSADGIGSMCGPACTDGSCGAGLRCDAGACIAIPCDQGFACAPQETCDPSGIPGNAPVYDRHHGCFDVSCTGDGDCASGLYCVNQICQTGLGTCATPVAVP